MIEIPREDTISVDWFNACFAEAGLTGRVSGFEAARVGTGQIGKCVRYTFAFADRGDLPASVIGKYPSDDENSRQTGVALLNFLKEVRFYQELQHRVTINTPRCYFEILNEGPEFFILLEDLAQQSRVTSLQAAPRMSPGRHCVNWSGCRRGLV